MERGRFAPSPTGDLHWGAARTALVAWLDARRCGGQFVLRIEDLDRPRTVAGAADRILGDLRTLGLDWDEGPDVGGPVSPYVQSERTEHYRAAVERLDRAGHLFPCYCSRADVARAATAPHGPGDEGPRYPGTCRDLTHAQREAHERSGRRPSLRFRVPDELLRFCDEVFGEFSERPSETTGDFIVRRADGIHAYQLAVVVDDQAMGITRVVRGADLLGSTTRQLLLYRALGASAPRFGHVPLVHGSDGERLAKRHGAIAIRHLLDRGVSCDKLVGWLGSSLGICPVGSELAPRDLIANFELAKLVRTATTLLEGIL